MENDICDYIESCPQCQLIKTNRKTVKLPMGITDTAVRPLDKILMDIVGPLPRKEIETIVQRSSQDHLYAISKCNLGYKWSGKDSSCKIIKALFLFILMMTII